MNILYIREKDPVTKMCLDSLNKEVERVRNKLKDIYVAQD